MRGCFLLLVMLFGWSLLGDIQRARATPESSARATEPIVVASKKFPESALLAEILAQALEARGVEVTRKLTMGNTALVFENLDSGNVDVYPEYTGTALQFLGLEASTHDRLEVRRVVETALRERHSLTWGAPLGFANSYAIAVHQEFARQHDLVTLSDLARQTRAGLEVRFGCTHEFLARNDGFSALRRAYGLNGPDPRGVEHGLAFELLDQRQIDATEVYTTEGLLHAHPLVLLEDDAQFFPPYDAAYLYGPRVANDVRAMQVLVQLADRLSEERMRQLNHRIEVQRERIEDVAHAVLVEQGWAVETPVTSRERIRRGDGFWHYVAEERPTLWRRLREHLWLTLSAVLLSLIVGVPLGYWASRDRFASTILLGATGIVQTIPALAFLVFMIPISTALAHWWGGDAMITAALLALFAYGLLPIVRNTKEGLLSVEPSLVLAATAMGMTRRQRLLWVSLPLAVPFIIAGVRTSAVIGTGSATLAAFVGAGGLGEAIISGLSVQDYSEVLSGAVPAALLALCFDAGFALAERWLAPPRQAAVRHAAQSE